MESFDGDLRKELKTWESVTDAFSLFPPLSYETVLPSTDLPFYVVDKPAELMHTDSGFHCKLPTTGIAYK